MQQNNGQIKPSLDIELTGNTKKGITDSEVISIAEKEQEKIAFDIDYGELVYKGHL